jgi:hypothetical protein
MLKAQLDLHVTSGALVLTALLNACAPSSSSDGKGILNQSFSEWQAPAERLAFVQQAIQQRGRPVLNNCGQFETQALNQLAKIPQNHFQWLMQQPAFGVYCDNVGSGFSQANGLTEIGSGNGSKSRVSLSGEISVLAPVFLHELGHSAQDFVAEVVDGGRGGGDIFPGYDQQFQSMAMAAQQNGQFSTYARSYLPEKPVLFVYEAWAEAFDSYYYSPESNQAMQRVFPEIHAYMRSKLPAPAWDSSGSQPPMTAPNPITQQPTFPTSGGGIAPPSIWNKSSLFVMIPEEPALNTLQAAAPAGTQSMVLCFGTLPECSNARAPQTTGISSIANGNMVSGQRLQATASGRSVFSFTVPPEYAQRITVMVAVLAFDASGTLAERRQIVLRRR